MIMIWMSLARASMFDREMEETHYPPCTYNVMCTCSKSSTDLGIVHCKNVPFPALPRMVNQSKVSRKISYLHKSTLSFGNTHLITHNHHHINLLIPITGMYSGLGFHAAHGEHRSARD